ncbi:collagenase [Kitasatospora sp. NPDC002040]|uniref:collagenase n=1 Tax=Kitasatospora sp. NPDC002040 TaxID=3154661 RepID=UPI0033166BFB
MSAVSARRSLVKAAVAVLALSAAPALVVAPASARTASSAAVPAFAGPAGPALPAVRTAAPAPAAAQGADAYLPVSYTCSSALRIKAQRMTTQQLQAICTSLAGQDAYFHQVVKDSGKPVAYDVNTQLEVDVFDSRSEYVRLAGYLFGANTSGGGVYMEGNPAVSGNQARFVTYRDDTLSAFTIKNLNHEYTHYLDGRYDMYGDWNANISTPTLWWIEGLAEYVSYGYLGKQNTWAAGEARKQTYALSTLFDTTQQDDQNRIYAWGYLAVYYLMEQRPADVAKVLGYYRTGNWQAARTYLKQTINSRYDADFRAWLLT